MNEQLAASLFDESTSMYKQGNYPACLALLNDCALLEPNISILYSNRAISNFTLKSVQNAIKDLQRSIQINHLNYIAYFNLFSINFLTQNLQEAFENLCFSLSSLYTVLSCQTKNIEWINQSIFYSYNNKQSIFLKAMNHLQSKEYPNALALLNDALMLQNLQTNKQGIQKVINFVEKSIGEKETVFNQKIQGTLQPFRLMTNIQSPLQEEYDDVVSKMLAQFNRINNHIHELQENRSESTNNLTQKSIASSQKMQKQTNCKTVYESNVCKSSECIKDEKYSSQESSVMRQDRIDKLHLYSSISQGTNEEDEEIKMKLHSYDLYPLSKPQEFINLYIQEANFGNHLDYKNVYSVFYYKAYGEQKMIRTCNTPIKEGGLCKWFEWSDRIMLTKTPQPINFTIFNKVFNTFDDEMVGRGSFLMDQLGYRNVQIFNSAGEQIGCLKFFVERAN